MSFKSKKQCKFLLEALIFFKKFAAIPQAPQFAEPLLKNSQNSAYPWKQQVAWIKLTKGFICATINNVTFNKGTVLKAAKAITFVVPFSPSVSNRSNILYDKDFKSVIFSEGSSYYLPTSHINQHFGIKTSVSFLVVDRFFYTRCKSLFHKYLEKMKPEAVHMFIGSGWDRAGI